MRLLISLALALLVILSPLSVRESDAKLGRTHFKGMAVAGGGLLLKNKIKKVIKRGVLDPQSKAGSIRNVNPKAGEPGYTRNCVNCSIATDSTLAGRPASAMPSKIGQPLSVLEKRFGGKFGPPTSIQSIQQQMASMPNGARGIVYGSRGANAEGHVFNVVKQGGMVRFLDGQTGSVASTRGYQSFSMLRTN